MGYAGISLLGVLIAAIAQMIIGMLWYGPLFGQKWIKLVGFDKKQQKRMKQNAMGSMVGGFITALVTAYVLAFVLSLISPADITEAALAAVVVWFGFIATTMLGMVLWEGKPFQLYILNSTFQLVAFIVMAIVLTMF